MHEIWNESITIQGLPYDILKVDETRTNNPDRIVLVIPGLPGYGRLYETFSKGLYEKLRGTHAVWVLSYCSFCDEDCDEKIANYKPLEIEVEHKLRFLENQIPENGRVTLIGHSIGAYIVLSILQILKGVKKRKVFDTQNPLKSDFIFSKNFQLYHQIDKCYFLFPAIERIQETPAGQRLLNTLHYLQSFFVLNAHIVSKLPLYIRKSLIQMFVAHEKSQVDEVLAEAGANILTPRLVHNALTMTMDNFESIKSLEVEGFKQCTDKIVVYYGKSDDWCPLSYREKLLKKVPGIENHIDEWGMPHVFMVHHSALMASLLAKHIKCQSF